MSSASLLPSDTAALFESQGLSPCTSECPEHFRTCAKLYQENTEGLQKFGVEANHFEFCPLHHVVTWHCDVQHGGIHRYESPWTKVKRVGLMAIEAFGLVLLSICGGFLFPDTLKNLWKSWWYQDSPSRVRSMEYVAQQGKKPRGKTGDIICPCATLLGIMQKASSLKQAREWLYELYPRLGTKTFIAFPSETPNLFWEHALGHNLSEAWKALPKKSPEKAQGT